MLNIVQHLDVLTEGLKAGVNGLMNIVNQSTAESNSSGVFFVNFNQDCSSLAVGTHSGYKLFSLTSVDFLDQIIENGNEDTCLVERLFSSSLVAIVSLAAPRKLKVCHFKKRTEICNYSYSNSILAVKLNRARLVVCLEESLYIHNIRDMKVLHTIRDTPPNPTGLCSLSINSDNCFLAYPGSSTIGEVQIFDAVNLHSKIMIPAHDSPLAALAFSPTGLRIATASEKGTVIRVFSVTDGSKLYEFRRGVKRCVSISSLSFSMCSQYLCCSSNTETVHVFKLEEPKETPRQSLEEGGWMGYLTKAVSASANYLPSQVTDVFNQGRAFATAHLPVQGVRNVTAITTIQNQLRLLVASEDGYLYIYNLDSNEGGDLTLSKQHRLDGRTDVATAAAAAASTGTSQVEGTASAAVATGQTTGRTEPKPVKSQDTGSPISSYAGVVKGNPIGQMSGTDSEKFREMAAATESPPKGGFKFDDDQEFPPVTQKSD